VCRPPGGTTGLEVDTLPPSPLLFHHAVARGLPLMERGLSKPLPWVTFLSWRGSFQTTPQGGSPRAGWAGGFMRGDPLTHSLGGEAPRSGEGVFVSWREGSPDHSLGDLPPLSGVRGIHGEEGDGSRRPSWVPGRSWIVWGSPPLHGLTTPHKAVP